MGGPPRRARPAAAAAAVCVVCAAAAHRAVRRARTRRPGPQRRTPGPAALVAVYALLTPTNILDPVWSALGWVGGGVNDAIKAAVSAATDAVMAAVDALIGGVNSAIDAVSAFATGVQNLATSIGTWAQGMFASAWQTVQNYVGDVITQLLGDMDGLYNQAVSFAQGVESRVRGFAEAVWQDAYNTVVKPIGDFTDWVWGQVTGQLIPAVERGISDLRSWADGAVTWTQHHVRDLLQPEWNWAVGLLHGVEAAWGWIGWAGTHTYQAVHGLLHGLDNETVAAAEQWAQNHGPALAGGVADYLARRLA